VSATRRRASPAAARERRAAIDDPEVVLGAAARYLETRQRSVSEVRRHLVGGGYRAELVEAAIERLMAIGILDDEAFARTWIESRARARPRGEFALRRELMLKGVDRSLADELLEEREAAGESGGVDAAAAERLLARHAHALARVADPRARRQRAYALLARNGFDPETAARVAATVMGPEDRA
jgi:regulatory protein